MALEEELTLNIDAALSEVDRLGATLTQVTQQFSADLASALDPLQSVDVAVAVETDTSGVAGDIDAAVAEASPVAAVAADTAEAQSDIDSLGGSVEVAVTADTSDAQAAVDDLAGSAVDASGSLDALGASTAALGSVAGLAGGEAAALSGNLSGIVPGGAAAASALAAITAAGTSYFDSATKANAATERFNQTFGDAASSVNNIDIAGLNTSLADLNLSLGSSTSQVREVLSSFGQLGLASGQTQEQIGASAEQLEVLAARAVALNPAIGSVGDAAAGLSNALARGGRFTAQYGIALTKAEIEGRALQDTGKTLTSELTQYEKAAAGAAVATEKYGDTLDATIAAGTQNPLIQLRAIGSEFGKFTTALGQPLVAPGFDLIRSVQPLLKSSAQLLGSLAQALLPIGQAIVTALGPLGSGVLNAVSAVVASLIPVAQELGTAFTSLVGPIVAGLTPALDGLIAAARPLGEALTNMVRSSQPLIQLFGNTLGLLAEGAALSVGAILEVVGRLVEALDSIGLFTNPLVELAEGLGLIESNTAGAADASSRLGYNARAAATDVEGLREAIARTDAEFADFIVTESEFARTTGVVDALRRTRIPFSQLQGDLGDLDAGLKNFVATAINAGQVTIRTPEGIALTASDVRALNGELTTYLNNSGAVVVQGEGLVTSFINQATATEQQSRATFDAVAAQRSLTNEQITALGAQAAAQFGVDSYTNRLRVLAQTETEAAAATAGATNAQFGQAAAFVALTQAVAAGTVTTANAAQAAQALGLDVQVATTAIGNAEAAINTFVSNALSKFPTVATAFEEVKRSANPNDPASLANSLNAATLAALTFQQNLSTLRGDFPETVAFLQEQGPAAAGAFAAAFANATPEVKAQLEAAIKANKGALGAVEADLRGAISTNKDAAAALGTEVTGALGESLEFDKVTTDELGAATSALKAATPGQADEAGKAGAAIGDALGAGIALGLGRQSPMIEQAARAAIDRANQAARDAGEIRSPSRLFYNIGQQLIAGLDLGITQSGVNMLSTWEALLNSFYILGGDTTERTVYTMNEALAKFGADRIVTSLDNPRRDPRNIIGDIIGAEAVVAGTPAALRAVTRGAEKIRLQALAGLAGQPTPGVVPPVVQDWFGMTPSGAPTSRVQGAVALWGDEVGNQIARSWTSGRLGTLVDQFQNARVQTPDTFVGNQRLGQLPGNATVVVNVEAPAGTDPMAAREFGQTVGIEVRKGLASMRAGVLAG